MEHGPDGWVEPFYVPDLKDPAARGRRRDQPVGVVERGRDRLFDQHVRSGLEEALADLRVKRSRRGDAHGIDSAEQLAMVAEGFGVAGNGDLAGALLARVGHAHELRLGQGRVDSGVVLPEGARSDDCDPQRRHFVSLDRG